LVKRTDDGTELVLVEVEVPSCLTSTTTTAKRLDNWAPATRYRRRSLTSVIQWRGASVTTGSMGSISPTYRRFSAMRRMTSSMRQDVTRMREDRCSRIPHRYGNYTCQLLENFVLRCDN
jgi:hypothetical protein